MTRCWVCNEEFGVDGVHICANTPFKIKPAKPQGKEMTDTVARLMALADDYANRAVAMTGGPNTNDVGYYRQCLQDELQKLFTPLSDDLLLERWKSTPVLDSLEAELDWMDYRILYEHFAAMHGIGETK